MKSYTIVLHLVLVAAPMSAFAGSLTTVQAHVDGNVSLADLLGGPAITDDFSIDGPPASLPLAGDALADSVIPSTATVQAIVETDALSVASETNNLSGVEPATTSANATLESEVGPGQWVLTVTREHTSVLAGAGLIVEADIAYSVTDSSGALVDETLMFAGAAVAFDTVEHGFSVADGESATLAASIAVDTASPVFGNALALSLLLFDIVPAADTDGDGLVDFEDNCTEAANPGQQDTDADGIGNRCDADLDNDCFVNFEDMAMMAAVFFSDDANADLTSDGIVNFPDLAIMKNGFFQPPGPSGVPNICD